MNSRLLYQSAKNASTSLRSIVSRGLLCWWLCYTEGIHFFKLRTTWNESVSGDDSVRIKGRQLMKPGLTNILVVTTWIYVNENCAKRLQPSDQPGLLTDPKIKTTSDIRISILQCLWLSIMTVKVWGWRFGLAPTTSILAAITGNGLIKMFGVYQIRCCSIISFYSNRDRQKHRIDAKPLNRS